jgi:hypothetical protein
MTEPTKEYLRIAAENAKASAKVVLQAQQDRLLRSIFTAAQIKLVDKWIAINDPTFDRPEAIRRLVELGLKTKK